MSLLAWRTAYASTAGTSHARSGTPCQDAGRCDVLAVAGGEVLVACVADGAGSAAHSELGARLVVECFHAVFGDAARAAPALEWLDRDFALGWLAMVQDRIRGLAADMACEASEFACTALGAVVGETGAGFVQIGDGAIVVGGAGAHAWVFWPQHGEYANSTFFVTMPDAAELLQFERRNAPAELALFSDGLERLILDMRTRTVHSPSLRPILGWLAATGPALDGLPSPVVAAFLHSEPVNRRTDDDKTLVLAVRA